MSGTREPAEAHVDDLRRRLYRPDATEDDLRRYLAERAPDVAAEPEPSAPRTARSGRPIRVAVGAGLAAAAIAAFALAVRSSPSAPSAEALPSAASEGVPSTTSLVLPRRALLFEDIGEGRTLTFDPSASNGPIAVPASVDGTAVVGRRYFGAGNALLPFDALPGTTHGGRMTVTLTTPSSSSVTWSALLLIVPTGRFVSPYVVAQGDAGPTPEDAATTFLYPSRPATQVAIQAPEGVGWTLTVAVAGGLEPAPTASAFIQ